MAEVGAWQPFGNLSRDCGIAKAGDAAERSRLPRESPGRVSTPSAERPRAPCDGTSTFWARVSTSWRPTPTGSCATLAAVPHSFELVAMTTAQLGLITTASVGVAAALAPAITARANREHERELARTERPYAQRHGTYLELTRFLERQRLIVDRVEPMIGPLPDPPPDLEDEAWLDMRSRWVTLASDDVQAAMRAAGDRYRGFVGAVMTLRGLQARAPVGDPQLPAAREQVDDTRDRARTVFDDAERVMNTELASL